MANVVEIVIRGIDQTKDGFTGAINNLDDLSKRLDQVTPAFITMGAAAVAAFGVMANQFLDTAIAIGQMSDRTGIAVDQLATLDRAAQMKGVDNFSKDLDKLSKLLFSAQEGAQAARDTFQNLGVQWTTNGVTARSVNDVLVDIENRFQTMPAGAEKSALAMQLFGKGGTEVVTFLSQGNKTIQETQDYLATLGLSFDRVTSTEAKQFREEMARTGLVLQGIVDQVMVRILPVLLQMADGFKFSADNAWILRGAVDSLVQVFQVAAYVVEIFVSGVKTVYQVLETLGELIGKLASSVYDFVNLLADGIGNSMILVYDIITGNFDKVKADWKRSTEQMTDDWNLMTANAVTNTKEFVKDTIGEFNELVTSIDKSLSIPESVRPSQPFAGTGGGTFLGPSSSEFYAQQQAQQLSAAENRKYWADLTKSTEEYDALYKATINDQLRGSDEVLAKEQARYDAELLKAEQLLVKGQIDAQDANALLEQLAQAHEKRLEEIHKQGLDFRASLDEAYKNGDVQKFIQLENSEAASNQRRLQGMQKLMDEYKKLTTDATFSMTTVLSEAANTFTTGFGSALASFADGTKTASQAVKDLGKSMIDMIISYVGQWIASMLVKEAFDLALANTAIANSITDAGDVAGAWAAAAAASAIATEGESLAWGAAVPVKMGIDAAAGKGIALSFGGAAHGGLDYVPAESTYLLQRGERVLSPNQNKEITDFVRGNGGMGQMMVEIILDGRAIARGIGDLSRRGLLQIQAKSVV